MRNAMPLRATLGKVSRFMQSVKRRKRGMSLSRFNRKYPNGKAPTSSKLGAIFQTTGVHSANPYRNQRYVHQAR